MDELRLGDVPELGNGFGRALGGFVRELAGLDPEARLARLAAAGLDTNAAANLLFGSSQSDTINGTGSSIDDMHGGGGADTLNGGNGDDVFDYSAAGVKLRCILIEVNFAVFETHSAHALGDGSISRLR